MSHVSDDPLAFGLLIPEEPEHDPLLSAQKDIHIQSGEFGLFVASPQSTEFDSEEEDMDTDGRAYSVGSSFLEDVEAALIYIDTK